MGPQSTNWSNIIQDSYNPGTSGPMSTTSNGQTGAYNPSSGAFIPYANNPNAAVNVVSGQTTGATTGGGARPPAPQDNTFRDPGTGQVFGDYTQYQGAINDAYNASNSYLDQAGGVAQSALDAAQQSAGSAYDTNASQLGNNRQTAFDTLGQQQTKGTSAYENALADARRIFQEQQAGAQQRFGGSSSAGQAASEIQSREQARQFGQTNRQYTDLVNNINTQHASVERDYQTGLLQLNQQKQASIQAATQDFNNKLLAISQNRAQLSQAKADASLQALQNLRNQVFAINQQNTQFQQQLALQKQQAQLGLQAYAQQATSYTNNATNAVAGTQYGLPTSATSATGGLGVQSNNPTYTGAISPTNNKYLLDQYGNPIGSAV